MKIKICNYCTLSKLMLRFILPSQVQFWSQHISFLLVGVIVVTSIRGLLIQLTKFFDKISSSKSSNLIVLLLAQIMVGTLLILFL